MQARRGLQQGKALPWPSPMPSTVAHALHRSIAVGRGSTAGQDSGIAITRALDIGE